ncbi:MAG TPA: heme exporter protein CcmB [Stellaceae bacterium]|nr:heme exporter protein CcmB [Stellaceae bacterium]
MGGFIGLIRHDLRVAMRQGGEVGLVVGFFVLAVVLFPFGVGPEPEMLQRIGPGVIWVAALLAVVSSLDRLFAVDYADGGLDLMVLSALPLEAGVIAKCIAHWLTTGLPLTVISPLLAVIVNMRPSDMPLLALSLLIGTPALTLVGAIGGALTLGARRPGVLSALLVLPLYVPPLIFGAGAFAARIGGGGSTAHLLLLGGFSLAAAALAPWAAAAALRDALE